MAAYAAVVSLMNTMENIKNHPRFSTSLDKYQIESLYDNINFLLDFVESYDSHGGISKETQDLETQIASAAYLAEDVIESYIVDLILAGSAEQSSKFFFDLQKVIDKMDFIKKEVIQVKERRKFRDEQLSTLLREPQAITDMGSAYAALVSLKKTMEKIQNHPPFSTSLDKKQIESLGEKVGFLLDFFESYDSHGGISKEAEDLGSRIALAAHVAEDVIEAHIVDQILHGSTEESSISLLDLQKVIEDVDSVKAMAMEVKEKWGFKAEQPTYSMTASSSSRPLTGKTTMVGFDGYLIQLLEALTGQQSDRQIIPIVGMGGIGKTTLARNVYEHSIIVQHFNVRAWVTVSQEFNSRQILLEILSCLGESTSEQDKKTEDELGARLHKILFGKRYLIVLDDVWSIEAWNKINFFFPDHYNKSRIIVTTRLSILANYLGSIELAVNFLDEYESWNLFCQKAFPQESCPPELEKIGKTIVRQCKGLPLSIVLIAGLLRKSSMTQEYWENISSILNAEEDNQNLNILSLCYNQLPAYLKPCFLYMGIFPENHEIRVSQLIKLWVAEGLLKPVSYQSLEEMAEVYLKDLIERNLILVCSFGSNGKFKTCKIHDLLRDLCIRVAEKEKFLGVTRVLDTPQDKNWERRIITRGSTAEKYYDSQLFHTLESTPLARTLICESPALLSFKSRLLRVLIEVYSGSLDAAVQQVNLRFLAYESIRAPIGWIRTYQLPSSISLLWNLETLIIDGSIDQVVAPSEIWEMPLLRHLKFHRISLPDPPPSVEQDDLVLLNLQTLKTVTDFRCSEEVCRRIPNIKKLRIFFYDFSGKGETSSWYGLSNLGYLNRLESLYCNFYLVPDRKDLLQNLNFPRSLKKLVLQDCELHWNDMTIVGSLPHLEVLKLKCQSVRGPKWNPVEGEFLGLKFLEIDSCYLVYWDADDSHFPNLEKLVLRGLRKLDEIPSGIGQIPSLQNICVVDCSISAAISAIKILEEQESRGNQGLQVRVSFSEKAKLEEFMEKVDLEGFTSNNFQIDGV